MSETTSGSSAMVAWLRRKVVQFANDQRDTGRALVEDEAELIRRYIRATWGERDTDPNMVSLLMQRFGRLWEEVGRERLTVGAEGLWMQALVDAAVTTPAPRDGSWDHLTTPAVAGPVEVDEVDTTKTMRAVRRAVDLVKVAAALDAEPVPVG